MFKRKNTSNGRSKSPFLEKISKAFFHTNAKDNSKTNASNGNSLDDKWNCKYRGDGFGGIHPDDIQKAINDGALHRSESGKLYDSEGNCYDENGELLF